ncbi:MAG: hypothetical protein CMC08_04835 [Flavobacteriaceae bacterium]|nr:hypothetical protein [Flavobacteriaceae bacterium]|tara:strand:- start:373 stop:663 length:291 start_codon:yes stop_codon:yes gene_type:complete
MAIQNHILITTFCEQSRIDNEFVHLLEVHGLIKCKRVNAQLYIEEDTVSEIERMFRLHRELGINIEGIDALNHMLQRISQMEEELSQLRKRLRLYE